MPQLYIGLNKCRYKLDTNIKYRHVLLSVYEVEDVSRT